MTLEEWLPHVAAELGLDERLDAQAVSTLLDLARDAAHSIDRTAAPLTTFLVGVAVGRGADLDMAAVRAATLAIQAAEK